MTLTKFCCICRSDESKGQPTVILAKTIKGYGLSEEIEAVNKTHQIKKMQIDSLRYVRDRFNLPFTDEQLEELPFYRPSENSPEMKYMKARREALGGYLRRRESESLAIPDLSVFDAVLKGSGGKEQSTTMVMVRLIAALLKEKAIKDRVVPIVPDEARTFGLEGMFRQLGIYAAHGQNIPEDQEQLMHYREAKTVTCYRRD